MHQLLCEMIFPHLNTTSFPPPLLSWFAIIITHLLPLLSLLILTRLPNIGQHNKRITGTTQNPNPLFHSKNKKNKKKKTKKKIDVPNKKTSFYCCFFVSILFFFKELIFELKSKEEKIGELVFDVC